MAPEVFEMKGGNEAYKEPLDCWAAGVLMYFMICGEYPFEKPDLDDKIQSQVLRFESKRWRNVPFNSKDIIRRLLVKDPEERFTAKNALDHNYFRSLQIQQE